MALHKHILETLTGKWRMGKWPADPNETIYNTILFRLGDLREIVRTLDREEIGDEAILEYYPPEEKAMGEFSFTTERSFSKGLLESPESSTHSLNTDAHERDLRREARDALRERLQKP